MMNSLITRFGQGKHGHREFLPCEALAQLVAVREVRGQPNVDIFEAVCLILRGCMCKACAQSGGVLQQTSYFAGQSCMMELCSFGTSFLILQSVALPCCADRPALCIYVYLAQVFLGFGLTAFVHRAASDIAHNTVAGGHMLKQTLSLEAGRRHVWEGPMHLDEPAAGILHGGCAILTSRCGRRARCLAISCCVRHAINASR